MRKLIRLLPLVIAAFLAWIFTLMGFTVRAAVFMALVLVSPAFITYGLIKISGYKGGLSPETIPTRGMPLDILAPFYDRYCPMIGLGRAFRLETLMHADLKAGENVLDIGCGTGPKGSAIGMDPAAKMIDTAKKNASAKGSRAGFRLGAAEELYFEDNRFDCVHSSAMLHHIPQDLKVKVLSEAHRVLKPAGRLVLVDVDKPANPLWWLILWPLLFWPFTEDQIKGRLGALILNAGFSRAEKTGSWGDEGLLEGLEKLKSRRVHCPPFPSTSNPSAGDATLRSLTLSSPFAKGGLRGI